MCGITGIHHYGDPERPVDGRLLAAMTRVIAHRGPDGEGVWSAPGIGLGHRRLAILDLSDNGAQPMHDVSGDFVITFNGEIYNFRELRVELEAKGHRFRSTGDTEVILAAYAEWGRDAVARLSGIFAFALYDTRRHVLLLARDPLGVKPLFYADDGRTVRFGSEIKSVLMDPGVDRAFDLDALDSYFTYSYTPAPATGFRHVRQLPPGHAALVTSDGMETWSHWTSPFAPEPMDVDFSTAVAEFDERLRAVTQAQMVSDVGAGAFLSGGLDSAALVRAMRSPDGPPVEALCVGFDAAGFDERTGARATAAALDVQLREVFASVDATELVPAIAQHLEEPTADSSSLPVYLLCGAAAESFKVVLSGDGADELLAGYETYRASQLADLYRRAPAALRRGVGALARAIPMSDSKYSLREKAARFTYGAELGPDFDHSAWRMIFTSDLKDRAYDPAFRSAVAGHAPLAPYVERMRSLPGGRSRLDRWLKGDLEFYLPNDMLVKVDRMSMAHGLEVRVPFLDVEMVRYCANLPDDYKLHRGKVRKHILRESLRSTLPASVLRAPKSGFNVPLAAWMRGGVRELLLDTLAAVRTEAEQFLDVSVVEQMVEEHRARRHDHKYALFTILMFSQWLENARSAWTLRGSDAAHVAERRG